MHLLWDQLQLSASGLDRYKHGLTMLEDIVRRSMPASATSVVGQWRAMSLKNNSNKDVKRLAAERDYMVERTRAELMSKLQQTAEKAEVQMAGLRKALEESEMRAHVAKVASTASNKRLEEGLLKLKNDNAILNEKIQEKTDESQQLDGKLRAVAIEQNTLQAEKRQLEHAVEVP